MSTNNPVRVLDLFSGIGAFSLGLERAGMRTVAFCEIEPFARRVLARHWPDVHIFHDVRELSAQHLSAKGLGVDLICGGFPCQDISVAGRGAGIGGERSGLWSEFARLIGEIRPRYAIVENVSALLGRGLGDVLGDLAALGYDAEWHCIPAAAVGAPHIRDRIWIVGHANRAGCQGIAMEQRQGWQAHPEAKWSGVAMADTDSGGWREQRDVAEATGPARAGQSGDGRAMDDTTGARCGAGQPGAGGPIWDEARRSQPERRGGDVPIARRPRLALGEGTLGEWAHAATTGAGWWATEPDVGRVVDGPAGKVDRRQRLIALGNSLVPQIPELIGRAILAWEHAA